MFDDMVDDMGCHRYTTWVTTCLTTWVTTWSITGLSSVYINLTLAGVWAFCGSGAKCEFSVDF
jgi:hypothetical protein